LNEHLNDQEIALELTKLYVSNANAITNVEHPRHYKLNVENIAKAYLIFEKTVNHDVDFLKSNND